MTTRQPSSGRKLFTVQEANATLPLVRAIVRDITALAQELLERDKRLKRYRASGEEYDLSPAHREEMEQAEDECLRLEDQLREYHDELTQLGVELKDALRGLVDFPCWMDDRVVYLCWRLDEPAVAWWHEIDAGFAGRQKLKTDLGSPYPSGKKGRP
jgi:hypothetical protein